MEFLESGQFSKSFVEYLEKLRFTDDLHAMCEGTVFLPNEPIARISASLSQAQLVETWLINLLHYQTLIASKAARILLAASGKPVIDFGLRRAHGAEAGFLAARTSYLDEKKLRMRGGFEKPNSARNLFLFLIPHAKPVRRSSSSRRRVGGI